MRTDTCFIQRQTHPKCQLEREMTGFETRTAPQEFMPCLLLALASDLAFPRLFFILSKGKDDKEASQI